MRKAGIASAKHNYSPSEDELQLIEMLDCLGFKCEPQYSKVQHSTDKIGRKRYWYIDIALPDQKIAVEIDGEPWHGKLRKSRDDVKDAELREDGWTVMRFCADFTKKNIFEVAKSIARMAMNHSGEYQFSSVEVVDIQETEVSDVKIWNFGVDDDESYIVSGGVVVHNCRGRWIVQDDGSREGDDPEFAAKLREILG